MMASSIPVLVLAQYDKHDSVSDSKRKKESQGIEGCCMCSHVFERVRWEGVKWNSWYSTDLHNKDEETDCIQGNVYKDRLSAIFGHSRVVPVAHVLPKARPTEFIVASGASHVLTSSCFLNHHSTRGTRLSTDDFS